MPNTWNELTWNELVKLEQSDLPHDRNTDSSVSAQYEDHVLPDTSWEHEGES